MNKHRNIAFVAVVVAGCSWFGGSKQTTIPSLGVVKPETLCSDVKRCEVRGDIAVNTLSGKNASPIHLALGQGPESYLGKVAPKRNANSVLKTCGGDVTRDDWLETAPAARALELSSEGKQRLRGAIKAHLAEALIAHPDVLPEQTSIDSVVDAATNGLNLPRVGLLSQTYWLKDSAFEKRLGQCGEENYADIIYSLTLLKLSDLTQKEIETKLLTGLEAKLAADTPKVEAVADAPSEEAAPLEAAKDAPKDSKGGRRDRLRELAYGTVQSLAGELRTIAALGFDEP